MSRSVGPTVDSQRWRRRSTSIPLMPTLPATSRWARTEADPAIFLLGRLAVDRSASLCIARPGTGPGTPLQPHCRTSDPTGATWVGNGVGSGVVDHALAVTDNQGLAEQNAIECGRWSRFPWPTL